MGRQTPTFENRSEAGRQLAASLTRYAGDHSVRVLGLPRGGVPVAFEVAGALQSPLKVFVVRKLGVPGQPELAFGAIAGGAVRVLNQDVIRRLKIGPEVIDLVVSREQLELERQQQIFECTIRPGDVDHRIVILVDDGLATGATMRAAVAALRQMRPARVVAAVPVGAIETCELISQQADELVCLTTPDPLEAVGLWYRDFSQVTDAEVRDLCGAARRRVPTALD